MIKRGEEPRLLAMLVVQQAVFLALGFGLWLWSGGEAAQFVRFGWFDLAVGLGLAAGLIGLQSLIVLPLPALAARMAREMGRGVFSTERPYGMSAILIISLSAGIGEEALFRAGIQIFAADYMAVWAAILAATALFALAHFGSLTFILLIASIGLIFGTAFHLTGSLVGMMIAHALFDVFGCLWTQRELRRLGHWEPVAAPA